ncbi:hypothetical protein PIB30_054684 [Stylosanthes scabra]|uniref:Uncharacterized protein n=1 Tax=Stylosanthes scabra TaxID=79078 RepID=A0ABU6TL72_9FABA|nr:hypothetical protein [Stylosanthes scabra]
MKTRRYHCDDEPFIHPLHSVRCDADRPYELPVESLLALRCRDFSKKKNSTSPGSGSSRRASPTPQWFPLLKINQFEKWEDLSRVGNLFRHLRMVCAMAMMLRIKEKWRRMGMPLELRNEKIRMKKNRKRKKIRRRTPRGRDACCSSTYGCGH